MCQVRKTKKEILRTIKDDKDLNESLEGMLKFIDSIASSTSKGKKVNISPEQRLNIAIRLIHGIKMYIEKGKIFLQNPEDLYKDIMTKTVNNYKGIRKGLYEISLEIIKSINKELGKKIEAYQDSDILVKEMLNYAARLASDLIQKPTGTGKATTQQAGTTTTAKPAGSTTTTQPQTGGTTTSQTPTVQQQTQQVEAPTPPPEAQAQAPEPEDEEKEEAKETAIVKANEPQAAEEGATPSEAEEFTRSLIEKTNNLITRSAIARYYAEKVEGKSFILDTYKKINESIQGLFKDHLNIDLNEEELKDIERNAKALTAAFFTQLSALDLITTQEIKEEINNKEIKPEEAEERAKALLEERGGTLHAVWLKAKALKIPEPVSTQADKLIATITSIVIKKKGENSLKGATQEAESIRRFIITMQNFLRIVANETTEIAIKNIINPKRN